MPPDMAPKFMDPLEFEPGGLDVCGPTNHPKGASRLLIDRILICDSKGHLVDHLCSPAAIGMPNTEWSADFDVDEAAQLTPGKAVAIAVGRLDMGPAGEVPTGWFQVLELDGTPPAGGAATAHGDVVSAGD